MWSSAEDNITAIDSPTSNSSSNRKLSSSTSTSSSCLSPFSPSSIRPDQTRKTMEDVWKDISISGLHDRPTRDDGPKSNSTFRGMILQDFLARPFKEPSPNGVINSPDIDIGLFGSSSPARPTTALSLNSGPEFPCLDTLGFHNPSKNSEYRFQTHHCFANAASTSFFADTPKTPFEAFGSSPALSSLCKKRMHDQSEENSGDRRHKRMIKNRESAARSRARKQA